MKIARIIVLVLAIVLPLLLFLFSFLIWFGAMWVSPQPQERDHFTEEQQTQICDLLMLELAPGETLSTYLWPGFGQGKGSLTITVHGIASEEEFLSRLGTDYERSENEYRNLSFSEGAAEFFLSGELRNNLPGLTDVMNSLYISPPMPASQEIAVRILVHPYILGGLAFELACILFLIFARKRSPRRKSNV